MKLRSVLALALALCCAPPALAQVNPGTSPLTLAKGGTGASTAAGARTNLGLGTMATQNASAVAITGGTGALSTLAVGNNTSTISGTPLVVNKNTAALPGTTLTTPPVVVVGGADTLAARIAVQQFGAGLEAPGVSTFAAGGTAAAPTATLSGDRIGSFFSFPYATSASPGYQTLLGSGLLIEATENCTTTACGSKIEFLTTPTGTAARILAGIMGSGLAIGSGAADPGAGIINTTTGYRIANAATSGNVLRGNGTNFVSAQLAAADLSGLGTGVATALGNTPNASGGVVTFSGNIGAATATSVNGVTINNNAWTAFTPTITSGTGTFTSVSATGGFQVSGKTVRFSVTITVTTVGTAGQSIILPLPTGTTARGISYSGTDATVSKVLDVQSGSGSTTATIVLYDGTNPIVAGHSYIITGQYEQT